MKSHARVLGGGEVRWTNLGRSRAKTPPRYVMDLARSKPLSVGQLYRRVEFSTVGPPSLVGGVAEPGRTLSSRVTKRGALALSTPTGDRFVLSNHDRS